MSSLTNEIHSYMTSIGAVREGHTGGEHIKYRLPNGKPYFTSLSPSDRRVLKNIKSETRRMLGLNHEAGKKAASYSKATASSGFDMETVKREQQHSAAIREIVARCTANIVRIDGLLMEAQRKRDQHEGERLVEQYMANKATLERYFQPVPELRCKSMAVIDATAVAIAA